MCRSKAEGGRRCPYHSTKEWRDKYNAYRRAKYAEQKQQKVVNLPPETEHPGEPQGYAQHRLALNDVVLPEHLTKKTKEYEVLKKVNVSEELNIVTRKTKGTSVQNYLHSQLFIQGQIDYSALDEESFKAFGFNDPNEADVYSPPSGKDINFSKWAEEVFNQSKGELKNLSPNEEASLIFYTGQDFRWFNEILYNRVNNPEEIRHDLPDNPHAPFSDQVEGLLYGGDYSLEEKDKTYEFAQEVVANMDAALSKAPKRQRVLYRGMSKGNKAFQHLNNNVSQITKWVDENLTLGQEIVFEGYQSSTVNPDIAKSYSGFGGGIVYEILTPEGINITSQSYYPDENEVILPRDSRYMVVGKHKAKLKWDDELPTHIIQLVAINNKGEVLDGTNSDDPSEI